MPVQPSKWEDDRYSIEMTVERNGKVKGTVTRFDPWATWTLRQFNNENSEFEFEGDVSQHFHRMLQELGKSKYRDLAD